MKKTLVIVLPFLEQQNYSRGESMTSELITTSLASVGDVDSTFDVRGFNY